MRKLRLRGVKWPDQCLRARKWQSQNSSPELPTSPGHAYFVLCPIVCGLGRAPRCHCARPWPVCPHIHSSPLLYFAQHKSGVDRRLYIIPQTSVSTGFWSNLPVEDIGRRLEREERKKPRYLSPSILSVGDKKQLHHLCGPAPDRQGQWLFSRFLQLTPPAPAFVLEPGMVLAFWCYWSQHRLTVFLASELSNQLHNQFPELNFCCV